MSSGAALQFLEGRRRARLLIVAARVSGIDKETCLHAALAMLVASWESYLERLVVEAQRQLGDSNNQRLSATLSVLAGLSEKETKKFNTPNADNSRNLLHAHTGYDPINDWHWPAGNLNAIQSRSRLDEILRVRHSFAHGFAIPSDIQWARSRNQPGHLTITALQSTDRFLSHLVKATDAGMLAHLNAVFGVTPNW